MRAFRLPLPTPALVFAGALALLLLGALASLTLGAVSLPAGRVLALLLHPQDSAEGLIVWSLRLPRGAVAVLAGAALGVSGALLQGVTRNPLADPGIVGVEAGAALALLVAVVCWPGLPGWAFAPLAFLGGVGAAALALTVAAGVGLTPLRLALAGVAVASAAGAAAGAIRILFESRAQGALFSLAGSLVGAGWPQAAALGAWTLPGLLAAFALAGRVNLLALGEDVARALGAHAGRELLLLAGLGVLLAASAVSVVGPIGFVGLVAPHLARGLLGQDHRRSLPLAALLGASLLLWADVAARLLDRPAETPVGLLITALGAPFFVVLARRLRRADAA